MAPPYFSDQLRAGRAGPGKGFPTCLKNCLYSIVVINSIPSEKLLAKDPNVLTNGPYFSDQLHDE